MASFRFSQRCPWPGLRGKYLLDSYSKKNVEIEKCVLTAGHIALILRRKSCKHTRPTKSHARVIFVVDAIPPTTLNSKNREKCNSKFIDEAVSASTEDRHSQHKPLYTMSYRNIDNCYQGDEAENLDEMIDELFETSKGFRDGAVICKPPLLAARIECRIVDIQFIRAKKCIKTGSQVSQHLNAVRSGQSVSQPQAPLLRCLVAREDGIVHIWEWRSDLLQWKYLNMFCFLSNPNLSWTKPVKYFAASESCRQRIVALDHPRGFESHISSNLQVVNEQKSVVRLTWWSTECRENPQIWFRDIVFEHEQETFRTVMTTGCAYAMSNKHVLKITSTQLGLWIFTRCDVGVRVTFQSIALLGSMHVDISCDDNCGRWLDSCHYPSGHILIVLYKAIKDQPNTDSYADVYQVRVSKEIKLEVLFVVKLQMNANGAALEKIRRSSKESVQVQSYRQLLLIAVEDACLVYNLHCGQCIANIDLTALNATSTPRLWKSGRGLTSIGVWNEAGLWWLEQANNNNRVGMQNIRTSIATNSSKAQLSVDLVDMALNNLENTTTNAYKTQLELINFVLNNTSTPAILLSAIKSHPLLTQDTACAIANLIFSLLDIASAVSLKEHASAPLSSSHKNLSLLSPASIDSIKHLYTWVLAVFSKIASSEDISQNLSELLRSQNSSKVIGLQNPPESQSDAKIGILEFLKSRHLSAVQSIVRVVVPSLSEQINQRSISHKDFNLVSSILHQYHPDNSNEYLFELICRSDVLSYDPVESVRLLSEMFAAQPDLILGLKQKVKRSYVERLLLLLPPASTYSQEYLAACKNMPILDKSDTDVALYAESRYKYASDKLKAYTDLLFLSGHLLEACHLLLECELFEHCLDRFAAIEEQKWDTFQILCKKALAATLHSFYFALLTYSVRCNNGKQLAQVLALKPAHIPTDKVLKTIHKTFCAAGKQTEQAQQISVACVAPILIKLLRQNVSQ